MSQPEREDASSAVMKLITKKPQRSREVREQLVKDGFTQDQVRGAVANLWDQGRLNVGLDQRLHSTESED